MIPFATIWICVTGRRISAIHIQISALHDGGDLRRVGIRFQAQLVLALVDLLRIVAVDAVRRVPVGVLLGEAADIGIVIPRGDSRSSSRRRNTRRSSGTDCHPAGPASFPRRTHRNRGLMCPPRCCPPCRRVPDWRARFLSS